MNTANAWEKNWSGEREGGDSSGEGSACDITESSLAGEGEVWIVYETCKGCLVVKVNYVVQLSWWPGRFHFTATSSRSASAAVVILSNVHVPVVFPLYVHLLLCVRT